MATPLVGLIQDMQVPQDVISFESWEPPSKSRSVNYDDVSIRGRSEPHVFYSDTGPQIWTFSIHLVASVDQGDDGSPDSVQEKVSFIESLVMPDYGDTPGGEAAIRPPHLARIQILNMINLVGTIRNPSFTYLPPYDTDSGQPYQVDCNFTFQVQREFGKPPLGFADVRRLTSRGQNKFL